jgi:hypothetical protein
LKKAALALVAVAAVAAAVMVWQRSRAPERTPDAPQTAGLRTQPPSAARIPPFSPAFVQQLGGLLRDAGVDVLSDATMFEQGDASAVTGFAVSEFQVRNMAVEIAGDTGGGFFGAHLDDLAPMPNGAPPISFFIAAWIVRASTPAAKAAADLMGPRNFSRAPQIVFPTVVLAAFVGEAVRAAADAPAIQPALWERFQRESRTANVVAAGLFLQGSDAGPCAVINKFIDGMLSTIFDTLKIRNNYTGVIGFFVDLYNGAVELAKRVVTGLVEILTAPIANALRAAIGIVGVASYVASLLKPWSVAVQADPSLTRYAVDSEAAPTGVFTARINDNGFGGWPDSLRTCARLFGIELPSTDADVGSPVTWQVSGSAQSAVKGGTRDATLPANKVARLEYSIIGRETIADARQGKTIDDTLTVQSGFQRRAFTKLQELLKGMVLNAVPGVVAPIANPLLSPITDSVLGKIARLLNANGSTTLVVRHHSLVRCLLFTIPEASQILRQNFTTVTDLGALGCAVGIPGGASVGYKYDRLPCTVLHAATAPTGVNPLQLGAGSFYTRSGNTHVVAFPPNGNPNLCVQITASADAIAARDVVRLAGIMKPRT